MQIFRIIKKSEKKKISKTVDDFYDMILKVVVSTEIFKGKKAIGESVFNVFNMPYLCYA